MSRQYHQGFFKPTNREKYKGDPSKIFYRSSYELKFMKWCDFSEAVVHWESEEFFIPYKNPIDGRYHRYFPDFKIRIKTAENIEETWVVEIKPSSQVKEPRAQKKKTKRYINEVTTYAVNFYKWKYAQDWCEDRGYRFQIITEKDLGLTYK